MFLKEVLPWMLQSPLFPNIGILMSSMTQSLERGTEVAKSPESLALKSWVLSMIADYMRRPFDAIAVEMVRCIVNLVVMEVSAASCPGHSFVNHSQRETDFPLKVVLGSRREHVCSHERHQAHDQTP